MKTGNRGQVLIVVALAIVVLVGFAALAVDVAYLAAVRNELQRCADSGALAGALIFRDGGTPGQAQASAEDFATRDTVMTSRLDLSLGEVVVPPPSSLDNKVQVITSRNVELFFAPIFGIPTWPTSASAVARAGDNSVQLVE